MVGVGPMPNYDNIEALNQQYYSQCLQKLIEDIELVLDEGLGLTDGDVAAQRYGTEFDTDDLLRMDSATLLQTLRDGKDYYTPNEGRRRLGLRKVSGGDVVYRQQQDYSIEALNKRDQQQPAPSTDTDAATAPAGADAVAEDTATEQTRSFEASLFLKSAEIAREYCAA
jgi:phage portal protein BeeE